LFRYFQALTDYLEKEKSKALPLLKKLDEFYVNGKNGKSPRFPTAAWSVLERVLAEDPCTTNFLEASHKMLDAIILCNHPRVEELGRKLWTLCRKDDKNIDHLYSGETTIRRRKNEDEEKAARVLTVCRRYRSDFSSDELLDYLGQHVAARPCPVVSSTVDVAEDELLPEGLPEGVLAEGFRDEESEMDE